jgi:histidine triad (HIT) family protein
VRTLVTGATGPLGSRIVSSLIAAGGWVRVLVRDPECAAPLWNAGCDVVLGDVSDQDAVERALADMDVVVHLAAPFGGTGAEAPIGTDRDATRLARAALHVGARRFVYASASRRRRARPMADRAPEPTDARDRLPRVSADCLFCRIVEGDIPATRVHETDATLAFRDIAPKAPVHVLVIPKAHHVDVAAIAAVDPALAGEILASAAAVAKAEGLPDGGYRVIFNSGPHSGQEVYHVHAHVLGGAPLDPMLCR